MTKKRVQQKSNAASNNGSGDFISGLFFAAQFSFFMTAAMGSSSGDRKTEVQDDYTKGSIYMKKEA